MLISACYGLGCRYSVTSGDVNLTSLAFSFFYSEKFLYQSMGNYTKRYLLLHRGEIFKLKLLYDLVS